MFTVRYDVNIQVFIVRNCFSGFETYCRVRVYYFYLFFKFFFIFCDCAFMRGVEPSDSALVRLIDAPFKQFLHLSF